MSDETEIHFGNQMLDITAPEIVEVQIRSDGTVLWVNVDGVCRLRICCITNFILSDERTIVWGVPK
jgi:hypothetical protein